MATAAFGFVVAQYKRALQCFPGSRTGRRYSCCDQGSCGDQVTATAVIYRASRHADIIISRYDFLPHTRILAKTVTHQYAEALSCDDGNDREA